MRICLLTVTALLTAAAPIAGQENPVERPKSGSVAGVVIDEKSGDRLAERHPKYGISPVRPRSFS
jgi:hypothetical protein